jgi:hypothetical protein
MAVAQTLTAREQCLCENPRTAIRGAVVTTLDYMD